CCAWSSAGRTACGSRCRASCAPAWWWRSSPPRPPSPRSCWSRERSTGRSIAPAHPPGPTRLRLVRRTACATELSVPGDIRAEDARPAGQILGGVGDLRSEEHTSELQSRENLVCRLLLEKKKKKKIQS